ncbi:MAG: S8 family serine peptidase [Candidatus Margulisiibacteriota bacterium]
MSRLLSTFIVCCLLFCAAQAAGPNQLIVKFKARGVSASSVRALAAKYNAVEVKPLYAAALRIRPDWTYLADDYLVVLPKDKDASAAADEFRQDANVVTAAPDSRVRAFEVIPNDPYYPQQWGLPKIAAPQAWEKTSGTNEVLVAVLDTGINYNHEDFVGRVNLAYAKDFVNDDDDPLDDYGHGTAISGVIGAVSNNGKGIAGLDWNCKILPIKVLDSTGSGLVSTISQALAYLAALKSTGVNVTVANLSLGQYNTGVDRYAEENPANLRDRCQDAYDEGIILVAAAGNGSVDWNTYPAVYPTVIAVAATDTGDKRSVWTGIDSETGRTQASNYSRKDVVGYADSLWVDVTAPGSAIYTTDKDGGYSSGWNGTSLASPYVAALAALVRGLSPGMTVDKVMSQISEAADDIDDLNPLYKGKLGSGRINVYRALAGVISEIDAPPSGTYARGIVEVTGKAGGWNFRSFQLEALRGGSVEALITSSFVSVEAAGRLGLWDTAGLNGNYTVRLRVITADLASADASVAIIVDNTSPEAAITAPAAGAAVTGRLQIVGKATDDHLDNYRLEYGPGLNPTAFQAIGQYYNAVSGGALGTWETSGLAGVYTIRLTATDLAGNVGQDSVIVQVERQTPTKEVEPQPGVPLAYALPNPLNRSATAETAFVYSLAGNFDATIYLFDLNGNLIWRQNYLAGEDGGKAGHNGPAWNGRNQYGEPVENGVYFYQITADRKVIGRGKIIVLN